MLDGVDQDGSWSGGTALVVAEDAPSRPGDMAALANAPLVAQLIATRMDVPQTRARRRVGGPEGFAAYGAASEIIRAGYRERGLSWVA